MAIIKNNSWLQITIPLLLIMLLAPNATSHSFTFPSFDQYTKRIAFQGDAFASNGAIQLTKITNGVPVQNSAGRASYAAPVRLWDPKTGNLAAFTTTFSFVVAPSPVSTAPLGDGIAFFIAPYLSYIPQNSNGGFLGLFNADNALNAYKNHIVAVEFDSFGGNLWDPDNTAHIGIDVNSIASVTTAPWQTGNATNGFVASATISYEPESNSLIVFVEYPGSHVNGTSTMLSLVIDLRTVLPEWVRIGFSGATGSLVEAHKILNWTFNSSFY